MSDAEWKATHSQKPVLFHFNINICELKMHILHKRHDDNIALEKRDER